MKKKHLGICTGLALLGMTGIAQATLVTIGTATYSGSEHKLIWDNDNNGNSVVWLDYINTGNWSSQTSWAAGLESNLIYNIDAQYSIAWDDSAWRLPSTAAGLAQYGCDGTTTAGYNITSSEMGHLYYEELGNEGYYDTAGRSIAGLSLNNTGKFDNLLEYRYWSSTEYPEYTWSYGGYAWEFNMLTGGQIYVYKRNSGYGLALRSGQVSTASPVPEPASMLLFSLGLMGLAGIKRRKKRRA